MYLLAESLNIPTTNDEIIFDVTISVVNHIDDKFLSLRFWR